MSLTNSEIESFLNQSFVDSDADPDTDDDTDPAETLVLRAQRALDELEEESIFIDPAEEIITNAAENNENFFEDLIIEEEQVEVLTTIEESQVSTKTCSQVSPRVNRVSPRRSQVKNKPKRRTKKQIKRAEADWRKPSSFIFNKPEWVPTEQTEIITVKTPLEYFKTFITDDMIKEITFQSNKYAHEKCGAIPNITQDEMEQYIGILLLMAIVRMPQYTMYWANETRYAPVADVMSRNRFQEIKRFFHIVDNDTFDQNNVDKLFKIRPFVESLRANLLKTDPEERQSIDEQVIPFKGRTPILQYNKNKPHKWGYKVLTRAGASGVLYDFRIYEGASTKVTDYGLGISGDIILELSETLPKHQQFKLYFDNWFSSIDLVSELSDRGFLCVGTIRENRTKNCPLQTEKTMSQVLGRGAYDFAVDANSGTMVVGWLDKKKINFVSNYVGIEPVGKCKRWVKNSRAEIDRPAIVSEYNQFMGGVDLLDMLLELYRIKVRTNRGYLRIIHWGFNVGVVNSWLIYRKHCKELGVQKYLPLIKFMSQIAAGLTTAKKEPKKRGRPSIETVGKAPPKKKLKVSTLPCLDTRYDQIGHFAQVSTSGRCKHCNNRTAGFTKFKCIKCNVHFCLHVRKNCFYDFHIK